MQPDEQPNPDYNFIMNAKAAKTGPLSGGDKKSRILLFVAGGGVLLVILVVIFSLIFSGTTNSNERLVPLAAKQVEIIRVAEIGEKQATSLATKNYASAIKISMTSANKQLVDLLAKQNRKVSGKELSSAQDSDTDKALTTARQTNKFDETFQETMKKTIQTYQRDLQSIYTSSPSKKEKTALESLYNQTRLLPVDLK